MHYIFGGDVRSSPMTYAGALFSLTVFIVILLGLRAISRSPGALPTSAD
jgi:hypothetical protein